MKIINDIRKNLLYIRFDEKPNQVINKKISEDITLDIGNENKIVGIEILEASKHVNMESLLPILYELTGAVTHKATKKFVRYLFRLFISLDQLFNTVLNGRPDHTVSGRVGFQAKEGKKWALVCEKIINGLFFFQPDHCRQSIEWDEVKRPLDRSY